MPKNSSQGQEPVRKGQKTQFRIGQRALLKNNSPINYENDDYYATHDEDDDDGYSRYGIATPNSHLSKRLCESKPHGPTSLLAYFPSTKKIQRNFENSNVEKQIQKAAQIEAKEAEIRRGSRGKISNAKNGLLSNPDDKPKTVPRRDQDLRLKSVSSVIDIEASSHIKTKTTTAKGEERIIRDKKSPPTSNQSNSESAAHSHYGNRGTKLNKPYKTTIVNAGPPRNFLQSTISRGGTVNEIHNKLQGTHVQDCSRDEFISGKLTTDLPGKHSGSRNDRRRVGRGRGRGAGGAPRQETDHHAKDNFKPNEDLSKRETPQCSRVDLDTEGQAQVIGQVRIQNSRKNGTANADTDQMQDVNPSPAATMPLQSKCHDQKRHSHCQGQEKEKLSSAIPQQVVKDPGLSQSNRGYGGRGRNRRRNRGKEDPRKSYQDHTNSQPSQAQATPVSETKPVPIKITRGNGSQDCRISQPGVPFSKNGGPNKTDRGTIRPFQTFQKDFELESDTGPLPTSDKKIAGVQAKIGLPNDQMQSKNTQTVQDSDIKVAPKQVTNSNSSHRGAGGRGRGGRGSKGQAKGKRENHGQKILENEDENNANGSLQNQDFQPHNYYSNNTQLRRQLPNQGFRGRGKRNGRGQNRNSQSNDDPNANDKRTMDWNKPEKKIALISCSPKDSNNNKTDPANLTTQTNVKAMKFPVKIISRRPEPTRAATKIAISKAPFDTKRKEKHSKVSTKIPELQDKNVVEKSIPRKSRDHKSSTGNSNCKSLQKRPSSSASSTLSLDPPLSHKLLTDSDAGSDDKKHPNSLKRTKVIFRLLPPTITKQEFLDTVQRFEPLPPYDYFCLSDVEPFGHPRDSVKAAWINFLDESDALKICQRHKKSLFYEMRTRTPYIAQAHLASHQHVFKPSRRHNNKKGKLEKSKHYKEFLAKYEEQATCELTISIEQMAEEIEIKEAKAEVIKSPLVEYLLEKQYDPYEDNPLSYVQPLMSVNLSSSDI